MSFIKLLIDDLLNRPWPDGTTEKFKNEYRMKVAWLMLAVSAGLCFVFWPLAIVPALVAIRKVWIVRKSKRQGG